MLCADRRDLRRSRGLRHAEELGVSPGYLARIKRGERNLALDSVDQLADRLAVAALVLLDRQAGTRADDADRLSNSIARSRQLPLGPNCADATTCGRGD